jgi:chromosomal replication initiation ATPase DnaA
MTPTQLALHQAHKARLARMSNAAQRHAWNTNAKRDNAMVEVLQEETEEIETPEDAVETVTVEFRAQSHIKIQRLVASHFGISRADLIGECRRKKYTVPRHIAVYLVAKHCKRSLIWMGNQFGGIDHSSVLYAIRKVEGKIEAGDREAIEVIEMVKTEMSV